MTSSVTDIGLLEKTSPSGCRLSRFVQGYWRLANWNLSAQDRRRFLERHVELGVTSVDHSPIYGDYTCEALFGEALALDPSIRQRLQIVGKCGINLLSGRFPDRRVKHYDTGAVSIITSVEESLRALKTDRLDLLLIHRPDPLMDADEVARAFSALHESGKVLHFGVSNFTPRQFDLLQSRLDVPLSTNQVEINPFSPLEFENGTLEQLQELRVRPMAWSPLAGGRVFSEHDEAAATLRGALQAIGEELGGAPLDQVAFAWLLRLPSEPLPVLGTGSIERVESALGALNLSLSREQWFRIYEAGRGRQVD
jgi:predicted oxidoreductase